jgi:hypothetical protein
LILPVARSTEISATPAARVSSFTMVPTPSARPLRRRIQNGYGRRHAPPPAADVAGFRGGVFLWPWQAQDNAAAGADALIGLGIWPPALVRSWSA